MDIETNILLAPFTTLGIGGPARYFVKAGSADEIAEGLAFAEQADVPVFLLGGGSNLVVRDEGYAGLVMKVAGAASIEREDRGEGVWLDVSAGTGWDDLVRTSCEMGLFGMECLAGIPGLVGGAPIQNIGAYGQEVSQTIASVLAYDRGSRAVVELGAGECGFGYRESIFNSTAKERYVVMRVRFRLSRESGAALEYRDLAPLRGTQPSAVKVYDFVRHVRDGKGMLVDGPGSGTDARSAGSFFRNPVVTQRLLEGVAGEVAHWPAGVGLVKLSAAWLIEHAGFGKGFRLGSVGVSTRHTLALTNVTGTASCAELMALRDLIVTTVRAKYGVTLVQEPVLLG